MADTPAPGTTLFVNAGGDLQAALNSAHCGDTIELQAGATFAGTFKFPAKTCDNNHWIIVRTNAPTALCPRRAAHDSVLCRSDFPAWSSAVLLYEFAKCVG